MIVGNRLVTLIRQHPDGERATGWHNVAKAGDPSGFGSDSGGDGPAERPAPRLRANLERHEVVDGLINEYKNAA